MANDPAMFDQVGMDDLNGGMGFAGRVVVLYTIGTLEHFAVKGDGFTRQGLDLQERGQAGGILLVVDVHQHPAQGTVRRQALLLDLEKLDECFGVGLHPVVDSQEAAIACDDGHCKNSQAQRQRMPASCPSPGVRNILKSLEDCKLSH